MSGNRDVSLDLSDMKTVKEGLDQLIGMLLGRVENLKEGLDSEELNRWYRIIEEAARDKAPDELREKINVIQDPDLPMKFKVMASRRAVPFLVDAIESNLQKMPLVTRIYFMIVEGLIQEEYRKQGENP